MRLILNRLVQSWIAPALWMVWALLLGGGVAYAAPPTTTVYGPEILVREPGRQSKYTLNVEIPQAGAATLRLVNAAHTCTAEAVINPNASARKRASC